MVFLTNVMNMEKLMVHFWYLLIILTVSIQTAAQDMERGTTALLIIDIQDFYFPGGSLPLYGPEKASGEARKVLDAFRNLDMLVVHVRHQASRGGEIHEDVTPLEGEKVITKTEVNAFNGTGLLEYLRQNHIESLVILGMQTHMCLEAATRAAHDYGFQCTVIADACATRDLEFGERLVPAPDVHASTLNTLNGTYARVVTADEFLSELKQP